ARDTERPACRIAYRGSWRGDAMALAVALDTRRTARPHRYGRTGCDWSGRSGGREPRVLSHHVTSSLSLRFSGVEALAPGVFFTLLPFSAQQSGAKSHTH